MQNKHKKMERPIEFYEQSANEQEQKNPNGIPERNGAHYGPNSVPMGCKPNMNQADPLSGFGAKLNYDIQKSRVDLEKKQIEFGQRLDYERQLTEMKMRYGAYMDLMHCSIYRNATGVLMFAVTTPDEERMMAKRLLNIENFEAKHFMSYLGGESVLEVTWSGKNEGYARFRFTTQEGVSPALFLKRLKAKGVLFLLSGKSEKKAAAALLAYAIQSAVTVELPLQLGWGMRKDRKWHYAWRGELTMKEVLKDAAK